MSNSIASISSISSISRAAVIGAGVMGSGIAAHLANVGIPVLLLDVVPDDTKDSSNRAERNRIAQTGLEKAIRARPASAFYTPQSAKLVTVGNTEDDLARLGEVDWIIEAVFEQLDIKTALYARLEEVRRPDTIVSSNTSGLPASLLLAGRSQQFRQHFLITHFFNPVRFMKLLELVAGPETSPQLMAYMTDFCTNRLGKGVVIAKDRPNFIGNRIGTYAFLATIHRVLDEGYTVEEADAILGPAMGRPRSAAFRTADLAGIDTLLHVADNLYENLPDDPQRELFKMPQFVRDMVAAGKIGDKAGQGFYKRVPGEGRSVILVIDPATLEYRPQNTFHFTSLDSVREIPDAFDRTKALINSTDRAGKLAWELTADVLLYTAAVAEEISGDIVNIDNAMRWGFNWEAGPFQLWDALGVEALAERMAGEGRSLPPLVEQVRRQDQARFYLVDLEAPERRYFDITRGGYQPLPETGPALASLALLKKSGKTVKDNRSATI